MKKTTNVEVENKSRKKKENNNFIKILKKHRKKVLMLLLLCAIIYIIYTVVQLIKNPTDTVYVEMGQIKEEELAIGYIIRDETILKGENYKNGLEQIKIEGEKVAKGEPIFRYYSNNEENLVRKIQELDAKIDEAMAKENSLIDTKVLEEQIDLKINELYGESDLKVIQNNKE